VDEFQSLVRGGVHEAHRGHHADRHPQVRVRRCRGPGGVRDIRGGVTGGGAASGGVTGGGDDILRCVCNAAEGPEQGGASE